ncbi:MAG: hypothetical protein JHC93_00745 [Parachlamydiales bacterium]|nr:hypothetical protein [Parachlamydiales bacterium]
MSSEQAAYQSASPFTTQYDHICSGSYRHFVQIIRKQVFFNFAFFILFFIQIITLLLGFTFLAKSSLLAFSLGLLFLTVFSYFVLRLYITARIPEQLNLLLEKFIINCKGLINYQEHSMQASLNLASAACQFAAALRNRESTFYPLPFWLQAFKPVIEKISAWWHWEDVQQMQELLLYSSINEHLKLITTEPTNIHVHASLGSIYVMLATLYKESNQEPQQAWQPPGKYSESVEPKFQAAANRAIEEFTILQDLAPEDPFIHAQLASHYSTLQMPHEEMKEHETVLRLNPSDVDTLYQLGVLYFQQGYNAKGLSIYEQLRRSYPKEASELIKLYGAYNPFH